MRLGTLFHPFLKILGPALRPFATTCGGVEVTAVGTKNG
jgi:hypothetical protein